MSEWWYAAGAQRSGPVDDAALKRLLQEDAVSPATLVWRAGLDEWTPMGSVDELSHLLRTVPPPLPSQQFSAARPKEEAEAARPNAAPPVGLIPSSPVPAVAPALQEGSAVTATPWRRWFARLFDLWIGVIIILALLFFAVLAWPSATLDWIGTPTAALFLTLGLIPAALVLDACIHAVFGSTAGKAILRIRIVSAANDRPGGWSYLARNLSMWGSGLAFGLPLLSLIAMAYQAARLRKGKSATYDAAEFQAVQREVNVGRRLLFAAAFLTVLVANLVLSIVAGKIGQTTANEARAPAPAVAQESENPERVPEALSAARDGNAVSAADLANRSCTEHFYGGVSPVIVNQKLEVRMRSLCYQGAQVAYSSVTLTPLWSAEHLTAEKMEKANALAYLPHTREELGIPAEERATIADFDADNFSLVPLTPPSRLATAIARIESSSLASVVPLRHGSLAIAWAELGESVALRARRGGDVFVISGVLFEGSTLTQLNDRLLVPTGLYTAFVDLGTRTVGAYVLENREGAKVTEIELPELERRAGVRLFPRLGPDVKPAAARKAGRPVVTEAAADFSTCAKPERSTASSRNEDEGTSIVAFLVDSNGAVLDSKVKRSSGHPELDDSARDAIRLCRFTPAKRDGAPYKSWTSVAYIWSKNGS